MDPRAGERPAPDRRGADVIAFPHGSRHPLLLAALVLLGPAPLSGQRPAPMAPGLLRVCADPANLPSSDSTGAGMENKLAELMARTWNSRLEYVWWAAPRGMMRMLNGNYCDVAIQMPVLSDMAGVTRPYYRTSYVFVQRRDAAHRVTSLDDPALKKMKIGVHLFANDAENAPPAMALSAHGVVGNLVGFGTVFVGGLERPSDIIQAVVDSKVDLSIVWGPIAGYYAKQLGADLTLTPVADDTVSGILFAYSMGMATRRRERGFRDSLQKFIDTRGAEIREVLQQYGVPLLPLSPDSAGTGPSAGPGR
jgi:quinoprotein dehydrogenase-associated probable ABC transporter substrate-binding protein